MKGDIYSENSSEVFMNLKAGSIIKIITPESPSSYFGNYILRVCDSEDYFYKGGAGLLGITIYSKTGYDLGRGWCEDNICNISFEIIKET